MADGGVDQRVQPERKQRDHQRPRARVFLEREGRADKPGAGRRCKMRLRGDEIAHHGAIVNGGADRFGRGALQLSEILPRRYRLPG